MMRMSYGRSFSKTSADHIIFELFTYMYYRFFKEKFTLVWFTTLHSQTDKKIQLFFVLHIRSFYYFIAEKKLNFEIFTMDKIWYKILQQNDNIQYISTQIKIKIEISSETFS